MDHPGKPHEKGDVKNGQADVDVTPTTAERTTGALTHQTPHRSLASVGTKVRIHAAWEDNAATQLGQ